MWLALREIVLYTFFIYGIISFVIRIFIRDDYVVGLKNVLIVKNQEDTVEWIVKNAIRNVKGKLIIVDMGSCDETWEILKRLKLGNEDIEILKEEDKLKVFWQDIGENNIHIN